jgi:hypothetical protein
MPTPTRDTVQLGARIPRALYRAVRIQAVKNGETAAALVERALRRELKGAK